MFRRIQTKILILIGMITATSVGGLFLYRHAQLDQMAVLIQDRREEKAALLNLALDVLGKSQSTLAYDYTAWDEMVEFVESKDEVWAKENIQEGLKTYGVQTAWVFDDDFTQIYSTFTFDADTLPEFPLSRPELTALLKDNLFAHFFAATSLGLIEFRSAPIQPSSDSLRTSAPQGYYFVGRLWNDECLHQLAQLTTSQVRADVDSAAARLLQQSAGDPSQIVSTAMLHGWDGKPLAVVTAVSTYPVVRDYLAFMHKMLIASIVFAVLSLSVVSIFLLRYVSSPLALISLALRKNDPELMARLRGDRTEFGTIANLIRDFFRQRNALAQEVLQREQAEHDVRQSLSLLQATLDSTTDGILVVDQSGKVVSFNPQFLEMWRISPELAATKDDSALLSHVMGQLKDPGEFQRRVHELYANPDAKSFEIIEFKDGRVFERYSQPQRIENTTIGRVWSFRDVSDQQRSEIERSRLEAQLRQSQKLETIGTLAGGIAHDFNNILTPIMIYTEMASRRIEAGHPTREALEHVMRSANRAKDLVKQILTFSRQTEQERFPVELAPIVKEATKLMRASIPTTIDITLEVRPDCGIVLADPSQIHQVLMNLCTNAFQAMRENGGLLTVELAPCVVDSDFARLHPKLLPGDYLRLTVSDTGCGMDANALQRIFEPFFTTKPVGEGTGLGLSVVHGIVSSHGGDILVHSELGKGTTFEVYFPRVRLDSIQQTSDASPLVGGAEHVLVVDDEPEVAETTKQVLEMFGYKVTVRTSSVEALELFRLNPKRFDLLITDQTMPQLTGDHLAKEIIAIRMDIPIILMTGFSNEIDETRCRQLGIDRLLLKPLLPTEIARSVRSVLDGIEAG